MNTIIFYCSFVVLFCIDLFIQGFLHQPLLCSMLALFCCLLFSNSSVYELGIITTMMLLEDFLKTNILALSFIYLTPIIFLGISLQKILEARAMLPVYCFFTFALICKLAITAYFTGVSFFKWYTLYEIFGNISMLTVYLKLLFKGRLGNHL